MNPQGQYPSTYDVSVLPPIAGGQDMTLICLTTAKGRIEKDWTPEAYIGWDGEVCAIGAVMVADGMETSEDGWQVSEWIENQASDAAKEAIALLNATALELYPESENYGDCMGPLEWINQMELSDEDDEEWDGEEWNDPRKLRVLQIYERTIEQRRGVLA